MPLRGVPESITPELLYVLARMGHGDSIVLADANFPSDSVAKHCVCKEVVRVSGSTSEILRAILHLIPLDQYMENPMQVMDRVPSDKERGLEVPAYKLLQEAGGISGEPYKMEYVERFQFYVRAKTAFCVIQTTDRQLYANCIVFKGVL